MTAPALSFPYTRRFYKERQEETVTSSCNYCFCMVAEASNEEDLVMGEDQHMCIQKAKAIA